MKQYFFHSFTSFEIIGQHKSGPVASVGRRGGGKLKCTHSIPLPFETDTSHWQKLTCRVLKVLIVPFSQAAKYNCKSFEPRSHFKSSLRSVHNQWHYRLTDRQPILSNQVYNQRIIPSSDVIQLTLTQKMTAPQVVTGNISHCQQQQSYMYSGLSSPGRSNSTYYQVYLIQRIAVHT